MNFADKLIELRRGKGWSQEELAEKMNVSRQAVTKWEGAQSLPDTEKLIKLSALFDVSVDCLLKDEIDLPAFNEKKDETKSQKRLTVKDAKEYLSQRKSASKAISLCVFLCIISPITLMLLGAISGQQNLLITENAAGGIGLTVLIVLIAAAVAGFIYTGSKNRFEFLENEPFASEISIQSMVEEKREEYRRTYSKGMIAGVTLCILSVTPIFLTMIFSQRDLHMVIAVCALLFIAAVGVYIIVRVCIIWESFNKLLQQGDYTKEKKQTRKTREIASSVYWIAATAIFLTYSFITENWDKSWIIMASAGILYPAILGICELISKKGSGHNDDRT